MARTRVGLVLGEVDLVLGASAGSVLGAPTPGPADLFAMGGNLMNPRRRTRVLDTALATSAAAQAQAWDDGRSAA